jgi:DNA-binding NarL/FixJ family response regulator
MDPITILIVDDHNLFRNGLKLLLNTTPNMHVIAEADNGKNFLDLLNASIPDIVLMDIDMPLMGGIEATQIALQRFPNLKIITLSMFGEEEYYFKMIDAGAKGFLIKNSDISEVRNAIRTVYEGRTYFSEELLLNIVKNIRTVSITQKETSMLSERENEVLQQICLGLSNIEIADLLHISKRTVDKHRANLLEKTNSKNTANLVMYAMKHKLIQL